MLPEVAAAYCLPFDRVGDDRARHRALCLVAVEQLAAGALEHQHVTGHVAGEGDAARGRRHAGQHRAVGDVLPADLPAAGVGRGERALGLRDRVQRLRSRHVELARGVAGRAQPQRAAPVVHRGDQQVVLAVVGRAAPLRAAQRGRADVRALDRRRRARVAVAHLGGGIDDRVRAGVDAVELAVLAGRAQHRLAAAAGEHHRRRRHVPVVDVVRDRLHVPLHRTAVGVQRDDRVGVEVGALADRADEVRRGVGDRDVERAGVGVERVRGPQPAAAASARRPRRASSWRWGRCRWRWW